MIEFEYGETYGMSPEYIIVSVNATRLEDGRGIYVSKADGSILEPKYHVPKCERQRITFIHKHANNEGKVLTLCDVTNRQGKPEDLPKTIAGKCNTVTIIGEPCLFRDNDNTESVQADEARLLGEQLFNTMTRMTSTDGWVSYNSVCTNLRSGIYKMDIETTRLIAKALQSDVKIRGFECFDTKIDNGEIYIRTEIQCKAKCKMSAVHHTFIGVWVGDHAEKSDIATNGITYKDQNLQVAYETDSIKESLRSGGDSSVIAIIDVPDLLQMGGSAETDEGTGYMRIKYKDEKRIPSTAITNAFTKNEMRQTNNDLNDLCYKQITTSTNTISHGNTTNGGEEMFIAEAVDIVSDVLASNEYDALQYVENEENSNDENANNEVNKNRPKARIMKPFDKANEKCNGLHYPAGKGCFECQTAGMRVRARNRRTSPPEIGCLSVDIIFCDKQKVLVGVHKSTPRFVLAVPLLTKTKEAIENGLLQLITDAEHMYGVDHIKRVHSDKEAGLQACRTKLAKIGIKVTSTEGSSPQSNGLAEREGGELSRISRASLKTANADDSLWEYAMVHSSYARSVNDSLFEEGKAKIRRDDVIPFGATVMFKRGPLIKVPKTKMPGQVGVYLGPSTGVPVGNIIGIVSDGVIKQIVVATTVKAVMEDGEYTFEKRLSIANKSLYGEWDDMVWVECSDCRKWRGMSKSDAKIFRHKKFCCSALENCNCSDPQDPRAWDDDSNNETSGGSGAVKRAREHFRNSRVKGVTASGKVIKTRPKGRSPKGMCWDGVKGKFVPANERESNIVNQLFEMDKAEKAAHQNCQRVYASILQCIAESDDIDKNTTTSYGLVAKCGKQNGDYNMDVVECKMEWDVTSKCDDGNNHMKVYKELDASDAQNRKEYSSTVLKELNKVLGNNSVGWPVPLNSLKSSDKIYRAKMLYGVKGSELDSSCQKDKARLVTGGHLRLTPGGSAILERKLVEKGSFWAPTSSLGAARATAMIAAIKDMSLTTVDLTNAYLQVTIKESGMFLELPKDVIQYMPLEWRLRYHQAKEDDDNGRVVFPIVKALYGLGRSGLDFIEAFHKWLLQEGWGRLESEPAVFVKDYLDSDNVMKSVILLSYVDDLLVASPKGAITEKIWSEIKLGWESTDPMPSSQFVGLKIERIERDGDEYIILNQDDYSRHIVEEFENKTNKKIKPRRTYPDALYDGRDKNDKQDAPSIGRSVIGGEMYQGRGTRPDLCRAINLLASRVSAWNQDCTVFMEGVLGFTLTSRKQLAYKVQKGKFNRECWRFVVHTDSNYIAPTSQSGGVFYLENIETNDQYLFDWFSKRQTASALSSTEAETVAMVTSTRHALAWLDFLEVALEADTRNEMKSDDITENTTTENDGHKIVPHIYCDNMAAVLGAKRGYSKQLTYLSRTFGVSVNWMHKLIEQGVVSLSFVRGTLNKADALTKLVNDGGPLGQMLEDITDDKITDKMEKRSAQSKLNESGKQTLCAKRPGIMGSPFYDSENEYLSYQRALTEKDSDERSKLMKYINNFPDGKDVYMELLKCIANGQAQLKCYQKCDTDRSRCHCTALEEWTSDARNVATLIDEQRHDTVNINESQNPAHVEGASDRIPITSRVDQRCTLMMVEGGMSDGVEWNVCDNTFETLVKNICRKHYENYGHKDKCVYDDKCVYSEGCVSKITGNSEFKRNECLDICDDNVPTFKITNSDKHIETSVYSGSGDYVVRKYDIVDTANKLGNYYYKDKLTDSNANDVLHVDLHHSKQRFVPVYVPNVSLVFNEYNVVYYLQDVNVHNVEYYNKYVTVSTCVAHGNNMDHCDYTGYAINHIPSYYCTHHNIISLQVKRL